MKITIARHAGYCAGVRRAIRLAERAADQDAEAVFTLGPLIHNPRVVAALQKRGMGQASSPADLPPGATVVLPSHGTPPDVIIALQSSGMQIIQAACPRVQKVHERVKQALEQDRVVYLAGDPGHTEVAAMAGMDPTRVHVISSPEQVSQAAAGEPALLSSQTTFSRARFEHIRDTLVKNHPNLEVFDSLCGHTLKAQQAAADLARDCNIMIVVGGGNSANTRRLCEACHAQGARVRRVQGAADLRRRMFRPEDQVGITAGASTPPEHIREIADWLCARFEID